MARNRNQENDNVADDQVTGETAAEETAADAGEQLADAAAAAPAEADTPIEPGEVTVSNAVSEDQMRAKVARMARGRKNYELCGTLKASPSTISNFIKGNGGATKQMLAGLGVEARTVYVVTDPETFAALGSAQ